MSNLSYEQHCKRDRAVISILGDIVYAVKNHSGKMDYYAESNFNEHVSGLSDEARRQVTEEVRQVLLLLEKLNKKRVM